MAEETLRYRVEIDQSDLASQLAGIKNQIDTALGSLSFQTNPLPDFGQSLLEGSNNLAERARDTSSFISEGFSNLSDIAGKAINSARVGYQKFVSGLEMAGLISPPEYVSQLPGEIGSEIYVPENLKRYGTIKSMLAGSFGMGYNYDMPISREEYRRLAAEKFGDMAVDTAINVTGLAGWAIPGLGPITTGLAAANVVAKLGDYERVAVNRFGDFIQRASFRNVGQLNREDSRNAAQYIRNFSENTYLRATVGDATDMENVITESITAGLFTDTANVEQFKRRAKEIVENFRTIQHTMMVTTEEAISIMGDISKSNLGSNIQEISTLVNTASTLGARNGYTSKEMLQFAQQGAEIVRGTGISMHDAALETMYTLDTVRGGIGSSFDPELIRQLGGSTNAALVLERLGRDFGSSSTGRILSLAALGGYQTGSADISKILAASYSKAPGSIGEMLQLQYDISQESKTAGSFDWRTRLVDTSLSLMERLNIKDINKDKLTQFMITGIGLSEQQAELAVSEFYAGTEDRREARNQELEDEELRKSQESVGIFERGWKSLVTKIRKNYRYGLGYDFGQARKSIEDLGDMLQNKFGGKMSLDQLAVLEDFVDVGETLRKREEYLKTGYGEENAENLDFSELVYERFGDKTDLEILKEIGSKELFFTSNEGAKALKKLHRAIRSENRKRDLGLSWEDIQKVGFKELQQIKDSGTFTVIGENGEETKIDVSNSTKIFDVISNTPYLFLAEGSRENVKLSALEASAIAADYKEAAEEDIAESFYSAAHPNNTSKSKSARIAEGRIAMSSGGRTRGSKLSKDFLKDLSKEASEELKLKNEYETYKTDVTDEIATVLEAMRSPEDFTELLYESKDINETGATITEAQNYLKKKADTETNKKKKEKYAQAASYLENVWNSEGVQNLIEVKKGINAFSVSKAEEIIQGALENNEDLQEYFGTASFDELTLVQKEAIYYGAANFEKGSKEWKKWFRESSTLDTADKLFEKVADTEIEHDRFKKQVTEISQEISSLDEKKLQQSMAQNIANMAIDMRTLVGFNNSGNTVKRNNQVLTTQ